MCPVKKRRKILSYLRAMCEKLWPSKLTLLEFCSSSLYHTFRALDVPTSNCTYDDCRMMTRAKELNIPCAADIVEIERLRQKVR